MNQSNVNTADDEERTGSEPPLPRSEAEAEPELNSSFKDKEPVYPPNYNDYLKYYNNQPLLNALR